MNSWTEALAGRRSVIQRQLLAVTFAFAIMASWGAEASICWSDRTREEAIAQTPIVFTGRVVAASHRDPYGKSALQRHGGGHFNFQVIIAWKGSIGSNVVVYPGPWFPTIELGRSYTVFARPRAYGAVDASDCDQLRPSQDDSQFSVLRGLKPEFLQNAARSIPQQSTEMLGAEAAFRESYQDYETALALYSSVLKENPVAVDALLGRARLLMIKQRYDLALDDVGQILKLDRGHAIAKRWRIVALFNLGRFSALHGETLDLSHENYHRVNASGGHIPDANLSWSKFQYVQFDNADLTRADFHCARLIAVSLKNTKLREAFLRGAMLHDVDLSGADLTSADLRNTQIFSANLDGARLTGARYNRRTRWPVGFDPVAAGAVLDEQ